MSPEQESYDHVMDHTKLVTSIKKLERSVLFERDVSKKNKQAIAPSTISSKILPTPLMLVDTMFSKEKTSLLHGRPSVSSFIFTWPKRGYREEKEVSDPMTVWGWGIGGDGGAVVAWR
jgi:hypothetical protein